MADQFIGIDARRLFAEEAAKGIGLGHKDDPPGRRAAYGEYLYPHDRPSWRPLATAEQSSCMTSANRVIERVLLPRDPELYQRIPRLGKPYEKVNGSAPLVFQEIGHKYGAWWDCSTVKGTQAYLDWNGGHGLGDMIWMGMDLPDGKADPAFGGHSHVSCVVDEFEGTLIDKHAPTQGVQIDVVASADGGVSEAVGYQIAKVYRQYVRRGGFLWAMDLKQVTNQQEGVFTLKGGARRVWGVLDPSRGLLREILEGGG